MRRARNVTNPHPKSVDARDAKIGRLVRAQRKQLGLSQTDLAKRIGVTFQQVQKYESGTNRISIGRLTRIAEALDVPPPFFFAGETKASVASATKSREFLATEGALRLVKAFDRFPSMEMRTSFVQLAESLAKGGKARRLSTARRGSRRRVRAAVFYRPIRSDSRRHKDP
jgi:transcriptional regulator with XRE-family HTH domain